MGILVIRYNCCAVPGANVVSGDEFGVCYKCRTEWWESVARTRRSSLTNEKSHLPRPVPELATTPATEKITSLLC